MIVIMNAGQETLKKIQINFKKILKNFKKIQINKKLRSPTLSFIWELI